MSRQLEEQSDPEPRRPRWYSIMSAIGYAILGGAGSAVGTAVVNAVLSWWEWLG
jgi:hypothetical protein